MQKINYKTFNKRRWWERKIGKMIKYKLGGSRFWNWATIKKIHVDDVDPLEASDSFYRRWNWHVIIDYYTIEGDILQLEFRIFQEQIDVLKLLDDAEAIIFKLEWEINWGKIK